MYKTSTAFNQAIKNGERIYVKVKCGNFILATTMRRILQAQMSKITLWS